MNTDKGQTWPVLSFPCSPAAHTLSGKVHVVFKIFQATLLPSSQTDSHRSPLLFRLQGTRITFLWFRLMFCFMAALKTPVILPSWYFLFSDTVHLLFLSRDSWLHMPELLPFSCWKRIMTYAWIKRYWIWLLFHCKTHAKEQEMQGPFRRNLNYNPEGWLQAQYVCVLKRKNP